MNSTDPGYCPTCGRTLTPAGTCPRCHTTTTPATPIDGDTPLWDGDL